MLLLDVRRCVDTTARGGRGVGGEGQESSRVLLTARSQRDGEQFLHTLRQLIRKRVSGHARRGEGSHAD
jgi:hypothetical protein